MLALLHSLMALLNITVVIYVIYEFIFLDKLQTCQKRYSKPIYKVIPHEMYPRSCVSSQIMNSSYFNLHKSLCF